MRSRGLRWRDTRLVTPAIVLGLRLDAPRHEGCTYIVRRFITFAYEGTGEIMRKFIALGGVALVAIACQKSSTSEASHAALEAIPAEDLAPPATYDEVVAKAALRPLSAWPTTQWDVLSDEAQKAKMQADACKDFQDFMFPAEDASGPHPERRDAQTAAAMDPATTADKLAEEDKSLRTDGAIVVKGGKIVWEHYDGVYNKDKQHCMWSASKSFTTGIFGALTALSQRVKNGEANVAGGKLTTSGAALTLDTKLSDIVGLEGTLTAELAADPRLADMTVEDFLAMNTPNPAWNEGYDGNVATSDVVKMLWVNGPRGMAQLASRALMGPSDPSKGSSFRYSSGNAVILMEALRTLFDTKAKDANGRTEYDRMPWTVLFDRIGMRSTTFERDQTGTFVGSSYAHMTLRDMARFGYLYLNGGQWGYAGEDGKTRLESVLDRSYFDKARVVGKGMLSANTTEEAILEEGSFYSLGFWINPNPQILQRDHVRNFTEAFPRSPTAASYRETSVKPGSKFFPNSPSDVFFAAGHYGQNILVFPKEDLLVVRMSHDKEYFSKLDGMMSKARACFVGGR